MVLPGPVDCFRCVRNVFLPCMDNRSDGLEADLVGEVGRDET